MAARDPYSEELKEKWDKLFKRRVKRDRAVILRDGELQALEGTAGDVLPKEGKIFCTWNTTVSVEVLIEKIGVLSPAKQHELDVALSLAGRD